MVEAEKKDKMVEVKNTKDMVWWQTRRRRQWWWTKRRVEAADKKEEGWRKKKKRRWWRGTRRIQWQDSNRKVVVDKEVAQSMMGQGMMGRMHKVGSG